MATVKVLGRKRWGEIAVDAARLDRLVEKTPEGVWSIIGSQKKSQDTLFRIIGLLKSRRTRFFAKMVC